MRRFLLTFVGQEVLFCTSRSIEVETEMIEIIAVSVWVIE